MASFIVTKSSESWGIHKLDVKALHQIPKRLGAPKIKKKTPVSLLLWLGSIRRRGMCLLGDVVLGEALAGAGGLFLYCYVSFQVAITKHVKSINHKHNY